MKKRLYKGGLIIGVFMVLGVQALPTLAEITKDIKIDSKPEGAEVYIPEGTRNRFLGKTPFVYRAEFHSEISVIRLILKKNPLKDATIEVSAKQDHVMVTFQAQEYAMRPERQTNAQLSRIQTSVNPIINQAIPHFLEMQNGIQFELKKPVAVIAVDADIVLLIDLHLAKMKNEITSKGKERYDQLSEMLWSELGNHLAIPLAKKVQSIPNITGIALRIGFDEKQYLFSVSQRIEESTEMVCEGGMQTRYEYRPTPYGLQQVLVQVYNPCLRRVPITKRELKIDPQTGVSRDQGTVFYFFSTNALRSDASSKTLYEKLGISVTNSKGDQLKRSGSIPAAFLPDKTKDNSESNE